MNSTEIQNHYRVALMRIAEKRLKEAFAETALLIDALAEDWQAREKLNELETSYRYMIQYMLDGYADPDRENVYNNLILSAYTLADSVVEQLQEKESNTLYYQQKRFLRQTPHNTIQDACNALEKAENNCSLNDLLSDIEPNESKRIELQRDVEGAGDELFTRIWTNYPATEWDYSTLKECFALRRYSDDTCVLIVTALTLNILHRYDEKKLDLLLTIYHTYDCEEVCQRALCSAVILLYVYRHRVKLSSTLNAHIESMRELPTFANDVRNLQLQLIKSREAERISRKLTDELIPEMMKLNPSIFKKINPTDANIEIYTTDENPEWQELLEQSGISNKLKELNELQMEGSDVFLSTFSGLKTFPFFQSIANWFRPFTPYHSELHELFPAGDRKNSFLQLIGRSRFLCNSDKYSFCLCVKSTPESQRSMLTSQFNIEGTDIEELEKEGTDIAPDKNRKAISNQYVQDLYRFFNLYHRKNEFYNPFARPIDLSSVTALQPIFGDIENMNLIAEFYFKKEFYDDALTLFKKLVEHEQANSGLYQKIGYCHQVNRRYEQALKAYEHAEMMEPDNLWTLRRIATCHHLLKNNQSALSYYKKCAEKEPENLSICLNIGHCFVEERNFNEALKYYFKADYLHPDSGKALRPIAWCSFLIGKIEQAQRYYDKILTDSPTPTDYMNAGHAELAVGNIRRALDLYRESISLDGNDTKKFIENFKQDIPDLVHAGIHEKEIPLILDQLLYQVL